MGGHDDVRRRHRADQVVDRLAPRVRLHGVLVDVSVPGNSNQGHEGESYGTDLSDQDKKALVESLVHRQHLTELKQEISRVLAKKAHRAKV